MVTNGSVGRALKAMRKSAGLTQGEAAQKIGKVQQMISHWETARVDIGINDFLHLSQIYGYSPDSAFAQITSAESAPVGQILSSDEKELVECYRLLPEEQKPIVLCMVETAASSYQEPPNRKVHTLQDNIF